MSNVELNILLQKKITTYLNYILPLSAILWDEKKLNWLNEHFIQLYAMKYNKTDYIWLDYHEELHFVKDISEYKFISSNQIKNLDIINFLKDKLRNNYYLMLFLDKYFLEETDSYLKEHEFLQIFLYGYNDISEEFYSIGFMDNQEIGFLRYSYKDIISSYEFCQNNYENDMIWVKLYTCILIKPFNFDSNYKCDLPFILSYINNYLTGYNKQPLRPEIKTINGENAIYGIKVIDVVIEYLKKLLENKYLMDYRQVHLIHEHKKLMLTRINFLVEMYNVNIEKFYKYIDLYKNIEKNTEAARMFYLKGILKYGKRNIYAFLEDKTAIEKIIHIYEETKKQEELVLSELIYQCSK
ncbi:MAG: hypothetical protein ABF289_04360 [Clostridiales bacterium]